MNLWAKSLRQLPFLAVALFFFSCVDETSLLGFRNQTPKFDVTYVELPLNSSVVLLDSFRTTNFLGGTNRWLVGTYADEAFGNVRATAYSQFFATSAAKPDEVATYDSVTMDLHLDLYHYGTDIKNAQTFTIHELTEGLDPAKITSYFNQTAAAYNPTPIGSQDFTFDPAQFDDFVKDEKDTVVSMQIPLSWEFGKRLFDAAIRYRDAATLADSSWVFFKEFSKEFKGIAIVSAAGDKIVGFRPNSTASRIQVHYHNADTTRTLTLGFSSVAGYSHIEREAGATALAGLTAFHEEFFPPDDRRYIQSGTGIITKFDLGAFYDFIDADSNRNLIVNEAELRIDEIQPPAGYDPINSMYLYAMKENSRFRRVSNFQDSLLLGSYNQYLLATDTLERFITPVGEGTVFRLEKDSDADFYSGFLTRFAQQLATKEEDLRLKYFALYPESPPATKSVNRIVFPADALKLRIYYTRSTVTQPQD